MPVSAGGKKDGLARFTPALEQTRGSFSDEVGSLSGAPPPERPSFGQSIARKISSEMGKKLSEMTPVERMNWAHPQLRLSSLPKTFPNREFYGEPEVDVCLRYYRRFLVAIESDDDEVVSVLLEFLKKHPIEFDCSGWVVPAFGYVVLGYPRLRTCQERARKLFSAYWRHVKSPLAEKQTKGSLQMHRGTQFIDSRHKHHWTAVVRWIRKMQDRDLPASSWFAKYADSHPLRCVCVDKDNFQLIRKAYAKIAKRSVDSSPAPSVVILEAVASKCGVSSSKFGKYRADIKKRIRKK